MSMETVSQLVTINMTPTTMVLLSCALSLLVAYVTKRWLVAFKVRSKKNYPPTPSGLPVIGHLHLLRAYKENPWEGFDKIRQDFGDIVQLRLGIHKTVMVSTGELMREVLLTKGDIFSNRPNFNRYQIIFGGDRENSLALCDWSELQRMRRLVAQLGILPRFGSNLFKQLDCCIQQEVKYFIGELQEGLVLKKSDLLATCSNIFTNYLCSKRFAFYDKTHRDTLYTYDYVFYDINQCYGLDFLPFITKFGYGKSYLNKVRDMCSSLRVYLENDIIEARVAAYEAGTKRRGSATNKLDIENAEDGDSVFNDRDFLDLSLEHHFDQPEKYTWDALVYEVLDLIGGHSAVGNLLMRLLGLLALDQSCQDRIVDEAQAAFKEHGDDLNGTITLEHRSIMPFTEATILETLRLASSPIVPHVATKDSTIQGFDVDEGTMILFNSYNLNMSEAFWTEPKKFNPMRFLVKNQPDNCNNNEAEATERYVINKPENFFPFSCGRRACLGYKMVTTITFSAIANLCLKFKLSPRDEADVMKQLKPKGSLALCPDNCFDLILTPRDKF